MVEKRDGKREPYNGEKIVQALSRAWKATKKEAVPEGVFECIEQEIRKKGGENLKVEEIQDLVEEGLLKQGEGYLDVTRAYVTWRAEHKKAREQQAFVKTSLGLVASYVDRESWEVKENANMGYSIQGLNNFVTTELIKQYWLHGVYTAPIVECVQENEMHIHDLGMLATYCCGWDMLQLIKQGFKGAPQKVESAPAKHFTSLLGQMVNFLFTLQGESAGAQAFSSVDTYLAPYVRADKLTYAEVKKAMTSFIFNLNVPTRVGFQSPFTNITLDLVPPKYMANTPVQIGDKVGEGVYGDYQKEMDMINKAFCEIMTQGDAKGQQFPYPIPTYNVGEDFDWESEIAEQIFTMSAKYGIPYFANFINSEMKPEDVRSMCCRLRLDNRELQKRGGGMFGANPLTGSIGVVTLNLPLLGYKAKSKEELKANIKRVMQIAKLSLDQKRVELEKNTEKGLYPYAQYYMQGVKNATGGYWNNHFSTIGLVGMEECMLNLLGKSLVDPATNKVAVEIQDYMNSLLAKWQVEDEDSEGQTVLYNLEATPAEGTSYRLAKRDKENYADILTAGEDVPYYTNSTQLPVDIQLDIFDALRLQEDLQTRYTGGTVFHTMLGEALPSWEACRDLVRTLLLKTKIPYITVSPIFSVCPDCGYLKGAHNNCPNCLKEAEVYARIVGFYRPLSKWNKGKTEEYKQRTHYTDSVRRM